MKHKLVKAYLSMLVIAAVSFLNSCASNPRAGDNPGDLASRKWKADTEAKKYNLVLLDSIQDADKIVIREHSDKVDFFGLIPEGETSPEYTYSEKELTIGEKISFQDDVMALRGVAKMRANNSLFVPHHTIDFYEQGMLRSTMKICFECPAIKWNGANRKESEDVFTALSNVITRSGMQPKKAWDAMARQRYLDERRGNPTEPEIKPGDVPIAKWAEGQVGKKVKNPFTGNLVDVEGIPANTKVRDPNDTDPTHVFRVPAR